MTRPSRGSPPWLLAWLSADWLSLIVALGLAFVVREGILPSVPW